MSRLNVVADANSVIGLAKGGVFDLLAHLVTTFSVPPRVTKEVVVNGRGRPGSAELAKALGAWVVEVVPDPLLVQRFSPSLSQSVLDQMIGATHGIRSDVYEATLRRVGEWPTK